MDPLFHSPGLRLSGGGSSGGDAPPPSGGGGSGAPPPLGGGGGGGGGAGAQPVDDYATRFGYPAGKTPFTAILLPGAGTADDIEKLKVWSEGRDQFFSLQVRP